MKPLRVIPFLFFYTIFFFATPLLANDDKETVWIDVRSEKEYNKDHIDGDLHIHYKNITSEIEKAVPDKSTPIKLYCAVGGRAGIALLALKAKGYEDVSNHGGIDDVREERGLIESSATKPANN